MNSQARASALRKLAFFGPCDVPGTPVYFAPQITVGQTMTNLNAQPFISPFQKRQALDQIVNTGLDVNAPAKKLFGAGLGAVAGNLIGKALGFGTLGRTLTTFAGAHYGSN